MSYTFKNHYELNSSYKFIQICQDTKYSRQRLAAISNK